VKYGKNSRIDLLLCDAAKPDCYVEVKNVHLSRTPGLIEFPDSVTARGAKHLMELAEMVKQGHRAVMVYLIQREDGEKLALAADLDPDYARAFVAATACGVEALAYQCCITLDDITVTKPVPILAPDI